MAIPRGSMETFTEHLDEIFYRMKLEILKQHDHQVTMQKLRLRALLGRSGEFRLDRAPANPRKMIQRMKTSDLEKPPSRQNLNGAAPMAGAVKALQAASRLSQESSASEIDLMHHVSDSEEIPLPPDVVPNDGPGIRSGSLSPKAAFAPEPKVLGLKKDFMEEAIDLSETLGERSGATHLPGEVGNDDDSSFHPMSDQDARASRRSSLGSALSLPSFFKDKPTQGVGRWRLFLKDADSSTAASWFAKIWSGFILAAVAFSLSQATNPPVLQGQYVGLVDAGVEIVFLVELLAHILLEPRKSALMKDIYLWIDISTVLPLILRAEAQLVLPSVLQKPISHYCLVGVVPTLRLLKLMRRFGKLSLVTHALRSTGDALKLLLFLLSVIVLVFSTLMYVVEPTDNIDSFGTAMWICTVTVTTVGYGDVTPSTNSGKILAGALCFISVLFMAMPISVLGNAMTHAWADRSRILLMTRTRQRLKNYGYEASDMPSLFRKFDSNGNGELTMDEFCDMIEKMNVGMRASEAEELFELFDTDASGGIDDKEFMKALFPDDYRRMYIRSTTTTTFG
ncbi:unnamed protein product [Effrenium voratum]|nr:unnamed protein product [Effrenium voratum]